MAIIFEGGDRVGKSSLKKEFERVFEEIRGRAPRSIHCDKDTFDDWSDIAAVVRLLDNHDFVDRLFDSECVYSQMVRGKRSMNKGQIALFRAKSKDHAVVFVAVDPDIIKTRYKATEDEDHYIDADKSVEVQREFVSFYDEFPPENLFKFRGDMSLPLSGSDRDRAVDLIERFTDE